MLFGAHCTLLVIDAQFLIRGLHVHRVLVKHIENAKVPLYIGQIFALFILVNIPQSF